MLFIKKKILFCIFLELRWQYCTFSIHRKLRKIFLSHQSTLHLILENFFKAGSAAHWLISWTVLPEDWWSLYSRIIQSIAIYGWLHSWVLFSAISLMAWYIQEHIFRSAAHNKYKRSNNWLPYLSHLLRFRWA